MTDSKIMDDAIKAIQATYKDKGLIGRLGKMDPVPVRPIPTGAITLDRALGVGGYPLGRIVEIYGPESSGKTTLTLHAIANAQRMGLECALIDSEHALDPIYARALGVDLDRLIFSQPDYAEQALQITDNLVRTGSLGLVVVDSVAALTPKAELDGEVGDVTVGLQARLMGQTMRKLAGNLNKSGTCAIFTNQIREKIGVSFGSPETTPGGRALKFYASQRLDIRRTGSSEAGGEKVANQSKVTVKKNKVAAPFKVAHFDIDFGTGVSTSGCLIDTALDVGLVKKSGSFFSYGETRLAQGRENAKTYLEDNQDVMEALDADVREALALGAGQ